MTRRGRWRRRGGLGLLGLEQALELGLHLRAGGDAELVAQQRPQPVVHAQRLDEVALRLAHAHQQQVAALAERRALDQLVGGALGLGQLGAAEREARVALQLARLQPEVLEPPPRVLEPRRLVAGQQAGVGELGDARGRLDDRRPVAAVARRERGVERRLGLLEVDAGDRRELHRPLAGVLDHAGAERAPQLGQHDVERLRVPGGRVLAPERGDQPLARDRPPGVQRQVGERPSAPGDRGGRPRTGVHRPRPTDGRTARWSLPRVTGFPPSLRSVGAGRH